MSWISIDLDDDLMRRVMETYGLRTKSAAVDFALRSLLMGPMSFDEALGMRGAGWAGDLDDIRSGTDVRT